MKEYNDMLKAAREMKDDVEFFDTNDEECRRVIFESLLKLNDAVEAWGKSLDTLEGGNE